MGARYIEAKEEHRKKGIIITLATLVLIPLLVFKYYNFVNESVWSLLSSAGLRYELHGLTVFGVRMTAAVISRNTDR